MPETATNPQAEPESPLEMTLDKGLGTVLEKVLPQLDIYGTKSPAAMALETEQTGLNRRLASHQAVVDAVETMRWNRAIYQTTTTDIATTAAEIEDLKLKIKSSKSAGQDVAQRQILEERLVAARKEHRKLGSLQTKAKQAYEDARKTPAPLADQGVVELWKPNDPKWAIDSQEPPDDAMDRVRDLASANITELEPRRKVLESKLAKEAEDGKAKRRLVRQAIDAARKAIDDQPNLRATKEKLDKEAADAADAASAAASTLEADIKAAQDKIIAKRRRTGATQAEVRQLAKELSDAENKLTARAVRLGNEAEKKAKAAVKANPDLILVDKLDGIRKALPKAAYDYDMVDALCANARLAAMEKSTSKVLGGLAADHKDLAKPGSKIERGINIEAGAAIEAAMVVRVRLTGLYGLKVGIEHTTDGKYKASYRNSVGAKLGGKLGFDSDQAKGVAIGALQGNLFGGQERTYNSLEDLLTAERGIILDAVLAAPTAKGKARKEDRTFLKKREDLIAQTYVKNASLQKRLRRLEVKGTLTEYNPKRIGVATTTFAGAEAGISGLAAFQVVDPLEGKRAAGLGAGIGGAVTNGNVIKQKYKRFSFMDDIEESTALQELHMLKADKGLTISFPRDVVSDVIDKDGKVTKKMIRLWKPLSHDETVEHLRNLDGTIANLKAARTPAPEPAAARTGNGGQNAAVANPAIRDSALLDIAKGLHDQLVSLRTELDTFTDLSQDLSKDASKKKVNAAREQRRKQLLKARGFDPNDTAAYIQSMSLQFTVLNRLCESANEPFANTADDVLPASKKRHLQALRDELQTPRIKLSAKNVERVYGNKAFAESEQISSTSFSMNVSVAATIGTSGKTETDDPNDPKKKLTNTKQQKLKAPSMNLKFAYTKEDKFKKGVKDPESSVSIVLDGNFSFSGAWADSDDMGTAKDKRDDRKQLANLVSKIIDVRSLQKLSVDADPTLESELTAALEAALLRGNGTAKIDLKVVNGKVRLKKVSAIQETKRSIGGGVSVATGTAVNVVASVHLSQNKSEVLNVYYGSNTLSEMTDLYRTNADDSETGGDRWSRFKKDSKLLTRMTHQLIDTAGYAHGDDETGRSVKDRRTLDGMLKGIRDGAEMNDTDLITRVESTQAEGIGNEMVAWLIDLKTSSTEADRTAADDFIDSYLKNKAAIKLARLKSASASEIEAGNAAMAAMEESFEKVIKRKTAKDDASSSYVKRQGFSRRDINKYVTDKLEKHTNDLVERLGAAEKGMGDDTTDVLPETMSQLRGRALKLYKKNRTQKHRKLIEDVMALDYAAKTLDDLTKFNDENDKNEAIGMLGADFDKLLKKPKVYINSWVEAELDSTPLGDLVLVPVVKKGKAAVVKKAMLDRHSGDVVRRLNADAGGDVITRGNVVRMISPHHGNPVVEWKDQYYRAEAREKELRKQGAKMGGFYTKSAAKQSLRSHTSRSISAQLEKLMKAQARKAEQRRLAQQQQRAKNRKEN